MNKVSHYKRIVMVLLVGLMLLLGACAAAKQEAPTEELVGDGGGPGLVEEPPVESEEKASDADFGGEEFTEEPPAAMPTAAAAEPEAVEEGDYGGGGDDINRGTGGEAAEAPVEPDAQFQASLTAGEIDDNEDFSAYLQYRLDFFRFASIPVHDVDVSERHTINVRTRGGLPVLGAEVLVYDGQDLVVALRTPATGIVRFHPLAYGANADSFAVSVRKGQTSESFQLTRDAKDMTWDVTLDVQPAKAPVKLDVLFLIDATGSMADEIDQLKNNILSISAQVAALPSRPDLRFGMVTYRDRGDEYITRVTDFTDDVEEFQAELRNVYAAGGGDEPESLNEGLHRAIWDVDWRVEDAVKLVFLIADAAPHLDYAQDFDYAQEMQAAAELGIKIHPIASSGLSTQGEFIFRQIGQFTGGHFIFLTYTETPQSSGEPGTEHHVQEGTYSVEFLDALVVRLIQDELAVLFGQ